MFDALGILLYHWTPEVNNALFGNTLWLLRLSLYLLRWFHPQHVLHHFLERPGAPGPAFERQREMETWAPMTCGKVETLGPGLPAAGGC